MIYYGSTNASISSCTITLGTAYFISFHDKLCSFFAVSMYCSMHTEWPFFTMFLCLERAFVYGQMSANGIRERVRVSSLINFITLELCSTRLDDFLIISAVIVSHLLTYPYLESLIMCCYTDKILSF